MDHRVSFRSTSDPPVRDISTESDHSADEYRVSFRSTSDPPVRDISTKSEKRRGRKINAPGSMDHRVSFRSTSDPPVRDISTESEKRRGRKINAPGSMDHRVSFRSTSDPPVRDISTESMELHEKEEEWIKLNVKQRIPKCLRRRGNCSNLESKCDRCQGPLTEHAETAYDLQIGTVPCDTYGNLKFEKETPGGKYIRMDVDTDMSLVNHLLLKIWRVPKPSWIISIIGEESDNVEKVNAFRKKLKTFLDSSFPGRDDIWVTSEGLTYSLSGKVGETVSSCKKQNIVPIGIYAWGGYNDVACIKMKQTIPDHPTHKRTNMPSRHCKFSIFADNGVYTGSSLQSSQYFRIQLEKMMAQHEKEALSIPYVTILYGGWSYIIDGVKKAIDENIPIIVLKGTGDFADALASVYEYGESKEKKVYEEGQIKWTGTVIDEGLREKLRKEFERFHGNDYGEGERLMLACLRKRELITVFSCDNDNEDHKSSLLYAVFNALLKSMTQAEKYRLVNFYMPENILAGAATGSVQNYLRVQQSPEKNQILEHLLWQLLQMDEAECVQFIFDYRGLDIVKLLSKIKMSRGKHKRSERKGLKPGEEPASGSDEPRNNTMALKKITSINAENMADVKMDDEGDAFKFLFDWAVNNNKKLCAALFWKKGENLLRSALKASYDLHENGSKAENESKKKELQKQGSTFKDGAMGLIKECYEEHKGKTIALIQAQSSENRDEDPLSLALHKNNREIFGTDAYKDYVRRVWLGKIHPKKKVIKAQPCEEESRNLLSHLTSPMVKFNLNLMLYIVFLALFGYVLLVDLREEGPFLELAVAIWWFSLVVEEIRQICVISKNLDRSPTGRERFVETVKIYFESYWNIWDIICLSMFFFGAVCIVVAHIDRTNKDAYDAGILILSVNWMFFTWRILQHLAMSDFLGPVLEMLLHMILKLRPFLAIMGVFIFAQGLAAQAMLYPRSVLSFDLFFNSLKKSFWNMFGEFFFDVIEASEVRGECTTNRLLYGNDTMDKCPSWFGSYAVHGMMGLYILIMNVLLLNIIIAEFNNTFTDIQAKAEWLAAWYQARITLEYYEKDLPPPFILLHLIYILIKKLMEYCCQKRWGSKESTSKNDVSEQKSVGQWLSAWERKMAENYLTISKHQSGSNTTLHSRVMEELGEMKRALAIRTHKEETSQQKLEERVEKQLFRVMEEIGEMKRALPIRTHKEETSQQKLEERDGSKVDKKLSRILEATDNFQRELASVNSKINKISQQTLKIEIDLLMLKINPWKLQLTSFE